MNKFSGSPWPRLTFLIRLLAILAYRRFFFGLTLVTALVKLKAILS